MTRILDIEICKWDEFNPKRDQKSYTWLRLNNDILTDPKLFGLDAEQKLCWIEILCQASKKSEGRVKINPDQIAYVAQVKASKVDALIEFLVAAEVVVIHDNARPHVVVDPQPSLQNSTPTNVTNERTNERTDDTHPRSEFSPKELLDFWNETCDQLPKARDLTDDRKRKAVTQLKKYPDKQHWADTLAKFLASQFCREEWKPGFDDFLRESIRIKALEGKYERKLRAVSGDPPKTREQQVMDHNRSQYERVMKGEL